MKIQEAKEKVIEVNVKSPAIALKSPEFKLN